MPPGMVLHHLMFPAVLNYFNFKRRAKRRFGPTQLPQIMDRRFVKPEKLRQVCVFRKILSLPFIQAVEPEFAMVI